MQINAQSGITSSLFDVQTKKNTVSEKQSPAAAQDKVTLSAEALALANGAGKVQTFGGTSWPKWPTIPA